MGKYGYFIRRLLLAIPTFIGITVLVFGVMQIVPGGPMDSAIAKIKKMGEEGHGDSEVADTSSSKDEAAGSITPEQIEEIREEFGFYKGILYNTHVLDMKHSAEYGVEVLAEPFATVEASELIALLKELDKLKDLKDSKSTQAIKLIETYVASYQKAGPGDSSEESCLNRVSPMIRNLLNAVKEGGADTDKDEKKENVLSDDQRKQLSNLFETFVGVVFENKEQRKLKFHMDSVCNRLGTRLIPYIVPIALAEGNNLKHPLTDFYSSKAQVALAMLREKAAVNFYEDEKKEESKDEEQESAKVEKKDLSAVEQKKADMLAAEKLVNKDLAILQKWWAKHAIDYSSENIEKMIVRYVEAKTLDEERLARLDLQSFGGLVSKQVMEHLQATSPEETQLRAKYLEALDVSSGLPIPFFELSDPASVEEAYGEALYFWNKRYLSYTELSGFERTYTGFSDSRYGSWFVNMVRLDFGISNVYKEPVIDVIFERFPISIYFGLIGFILGYMVCVPLGVMKAIKHNSRFDLVSSIIVFIGYSTPGWALGAVLLGWLGGGLGIVPLGGFRSDNWEQLSMIGKVLDQLHHSILPIMAYAVASFATLTVLTKNSLMEHLGADYVRTAFAKGLSERRVVFLHALRNSLIPLAGGLGHAFSLVLAGSYLVEKVFNINGFGLLGYHSLLAQDYFVIMGTLVIGSLLALFGNILSDFIYTVVDPRISFK